MNRSQCESSVLRVNAAQTAVRLLIAMTIVANTISAAESSPARWEKAIESFERSDMVNPPRQRGTLFVGSSSIRLWKLEEYFPGMHAINRGFGGSHVEDALHYVDRIILPHQPRTVVVYAGDNDLAAGKSPKRVLSDFQALVTAIHGELPNTKIVYIAIKPSIKRWNLIESVRLANRLIRTECEEHARLEFVDIDTPMIGPDKLPRKELFVKDGLHLSAAGYRIWSDLVRPHLAVDAVDSLDWPQFRGPRGNGHARAGLPAPLKWSEDQNVTWKTPIRGRGWSSPVVIGSEIWLTSATEDGRKMFVVCVDRQSGRVIHDIDLFANSMVREKHLLNSYASPTPVAEGDFVYVHFGSYGTACIRRATAETIWERRDLPCHHWRGPGSSPMIFEDLLIVHFDGYDFQYVVALDKQTGNTVWKVDRTVEYGTDNGDIMKAFCTPIVIEVDGRQQLISPTSKATLAYDPRTGEEIWRVRYNEFSATARPLFEAGMLFINTGFSKAKFLAVAPDGEGDVTDSHVRWTASKGIGSKPSPIMVDDLIYLVHDAGTLVCLDAVSGEQVWNKRLGGKFSASPIYAGGHLYFCSHEGMTTVVKPGRACQVVAKNSLEDGFMASPAASGDCLILRTRSHLYRIQE